LCQDFDLRADIRWGPKRAPKKFQLSAKDGLVSHYTDSGTYLPPELGMFVEMFRKKVRDWEIIEQTELLPLGDTFWVPDFQLLHRETGQVVYLEVLGFWRRASAGQHLERLKRFAPAPFVLAVSDQLHVEEADAETLPGGLYHFRQMPLAEEVARIAAEQLQFGDKK
jgi:predicted nuclease of restriction endonuclease-like RecB superfamily